MNEPILVLNAGSSSLKFSVFETLPDRSLSEGLHGQIENIGNAQAHFEVASRDGGSLGEAKLDNSTVQGAVEAIHAWFADHVGAEASFAAAGHRVVHGGTDFTAPVMIDDHVLIQIESLIPLAPLHQPANLVAIEAVRAVAPRLPQIACFDTSFHRDQPRLAQLFGLPRRFAEQGVLRYGFHGLSYEYIAGVLPAGLRQGKVIVAHLGNGASLCAMSEGQSIASSMAFSTLDGLLMGTRCGAIDPGVLLYLLRHEGMDAAALEHLLYRESGLLVVSGLSADMRSLLENDSSQAREAVDLFVYRLVRELGALAAELGGVDAVVFTGGIGEHANVIRERVASKIAWLGAEILMIPTNENLMIGRAARRLLDESLVQKTK